MHLPKYLTKYNLHLKFNDLFKGYCMKYVPVIRNNKTL